MTRTRKIIITSVAVVALVGGGAAVAVAQQTPDEPDLDRATQAALDEVGDGDVVGVEQDDDGGYDVEVRQPDGTETEVDLDADFEVTRTDQERENDDIDDLPIDDATRTRAADAALASVDDGVVVSVESDDGGYDVEIRHPDGTETEVSLDADFAVTSTEQDDD